MQSLLTSYVKAVTGPLIPGGGDELPERTVEREVEIVPDRVAAYSRVCGFELRSTLPPTYPHILGFPLEMELMTARDFPFALLGMVHIANRIDQRRAVPLDARPRVRVWAENLRPHRRGRQLDLVTEASLDGEVAWLEHSTYLRRGKGGDESAREAPLVDDPEGLPASAVWKLDGDIGRRYADVSGDRNPIHMHPLSARVFGFPGAIAHGMWMKARCLAAFDGRIPDAHTSAVEFRQPLRIPGRAELRSESDGAGGWRFALAEPGGEKTHLVGRIDA